MSPAAGVQDGRTRTPFAAGRPSPVANVGLWAANDQRKAMNALRALVQRNNVLASGAFSFTGIGLLSSLHHHVDATSFTMILGSMGATSVLVYGYPQAAFSQPAAVIGSHVMCGAIGVSVHGAMCQGIVDPWLMAPVAASLSTMVGAAAYLLAHCHPFHPSPSPFTVPPPPPPPCRRLEQRSRQCGRRIRTDPCWGRRG